MEEANLIAVNQITEEAAWELFKKQSIKLMMENGILLFWVKFKKEDLQQKLEPVFK